MYFIYAEKRLFNICNTFGGALKKADRIKDMHISIYENKKIIMEIKKVERNDKT